MWYIKPRTLTMFVVGLAVLALGAANLSAQQATTTSGKITAAYTHQDSIVVGDIEGHVMSLVTAEGKNISAGENAFMDGAQIVNLSFSDLVRGNGSHQGYIVFTKDGDAAYSKWEGEVATVLDSTGAPVTTFRGVFSYTKGAGQFEGIKGNGTYKGQFTSTTEYSVEWQSDYVIEK